MSTQGTKKESKSATAAQVDGMVVNDQQPRAAVTTDAGFASIEIQAGPRNGRPERLVIARLGETEVGRDQLDTNEAKARDRFVEGVSKMTGQPVSDLTYLHQKIAAKADEADRCVADADDGSGGDPGVGSPSQATRLVELATDAELFHTADGTGYATIELAGHRETWLLSTKKFRNWLAQKFFAKEKKAAGSQAIQDALSTLAGKALFDGAEHEVHVRMAWHEGRLYLDLGDAEWQVVMVSSAGFSVISDSPVKFRRPKGLLPLPVPVVGGTIDDLRPFVNVTDADWPLWVGGLFANYQPEGGLPVVVLNGEQGSAKSTTARVARELIDPNGAPLRSQPRSEHDLCIAAENSCKVSLDNLSYLPIWLSDALCRLSTGGGFSARELYTDSDETLFKGRRGITLNGIEELATRSDLLDRSIIFRLPNISTRKTEKRFWQEFNAARPRILGALLNAVAAAIRKLDKVKEVELPRMADFARWVVAGESGLGLKKGAFLNAYLNNRSSANALAIEASAISQPLMKFIEKQLVSPGNPWQGTATVLLANLKSQYDGIGRLPQGFPTTPTALSGKLNRIAPNLRANGITVETSKSGNRLITITVAPESWNAANSQDGKSCRVPGDDE